jgi:uncharacterized protein (TIGR02145 family)
MTAFFSLFYLNCSNSNISNVQNEETYTVEIASQNCFVVKFPDQRSYKLNQIVTIVAQPRYGYYFSSWEGSLSDKNDSIVITVKNNLNLAAICLANQTDSVVDIDGNVYKTIRIGRQVWSSENLRVRNYNDGSPITFDSAANSKWFKNTTEKYCFYNNSTDTAFRRKYGAIYNWYAVNSRKLAPIGWHVPTSSDFIELIEYLDSNGYNWDPDSGKYLVAKSLASNANWTAYNGIYKEGAIGFEQSKNNKSGFCGLPGGCRPGYGAFEDFGGRGFWWTSDSSSLSDYNTDISTAYCLFNDMRSVELGNGLGCWNGFSVRIIKDN